jgi:nucleoside-diphosphate-sugar epimerase
MLCGQVPEIMSNGLGMRDYLYVEDAIKGYMLVAAEMGRPEVCGQTFTFCSESPITVLTIVETILKQMGHGNLKPRVLGRGGNTSSTRPSSAGKARELLGWAADSSLESGLQKTIEWYRAHANELNLEARNG